MVWCLPSRRVWQRASRVAADGAFRTTLAEILKFVNEVPFAAIRFILDSAKLNCALSQEGLSGNWGLHIGATLENSARAVCWRKISLHPL